MYRLCELNLNGNLKDNSQIVTIYNEILKTALRLGTDKAIEMDALVARVQIANADAKIAQYRKEMAQLVSSQESLEKVIKEQESLLKAEREKVASDSETIKRLEEQLADSKINLEKVNLEKNALVANRAVAEASREQGL